MATKYVLAVDLGTGGPKVALVSTEGEVAGYEYRKNRIVLTPDGGVEQDPEEWWETITDGVKCLLARNLVPASDILAISMTGHWMGTVAVDEKGRALGNSVIWMDSRGAPHATRAISGGIEVPGTGYNALRLFRWVRLTGGAPSRTGKDPVGHILFLKHERPEVYRAAHLFLEPLDYLTFRLTGRAVTSYGLIVGHWCTDNRDLANVRYDEGLVRQGGLERGKLPELVPTGSVIGPLLPGIARELGLDPAVRVVTSTADTASAGIGAGAVRDYDAHVYIGTSSWLSCHVPWKRTDVTINVASLPSGIPGRYWVATEQESAGKCLSWLIENVLFPDDGLGTGAPPEDVLRRLNEMAAAVPPGSHGTLFLPWLNGEKTPVDDHLVRGGWFNVGLGTDRRTLVRSVLEGVALNTRWMLGAAERFVRKDHPEGFRELRFIGGGANSPLWCQILADVTGRRIRQIDQPVLANARGAALAASVALGHLTWNDVPAKVRIARDFEPNESNRPTYDRLFATFLELYEKTRGVYARVAKERANA